MNDNALHLAKNTFSSFFHQKTKLRPRGATGEQKKNELRARSMSLRAFFHTRLKDTLRRYSSSTLPALVLRQLLSTIISEETDRHKRIVYNMGLPYILT